MNIDQIFGKDICNWGYVETPEQTEKKELVSNSQAADGASSSGQIQEYDELISKAISAADRTKKSQKQQHSSPKSSPTTQELPAAKAVTFSASTVQASSTRQPNMKNHEIYTDHSEEEDPDLNVLPAVSPNYALRTSPNSKTQQSDVTMQTDNLSPFPRLNLSNEPSSGRERTATLESELTSDSSVGADSTSGFSKKMLIKLMKEQVNLVRDLTNAQIANKKELEKIREEKERLEKEKLERENGAAVGGGDAAASSKPTANGDMSSSQQQLKQLYQKSHPTTTHSKLNLPQNVQRDTSDSRSVSSKSIMDRFRDFRNTPRQPQMYPRQHPDAKYYANRNRAFSGDTYGEATMNNAGVSMASTILPTQIMVGQDSHPNNGFNQNAQQQQYNRDKIEITPIPERNVVPPPKSTCFGSFWIFFSHLVTLFIPDVLLCCIGRHAKFTKGMNEAQKAEVRKAKKEAKQAWREKVGIFVVMLLCSCAFIGISGVIPVLLCRETTVFTMDEIQARDRTEDWTVIFGTIYDIAEYIPLHPGGKSSILDAVAQDASKVFPRRPVGRLPEMCMNPNAELTTDVACNEFDEVDKLVNLHCHTNIVGFSGISRAFGKYERGILAHRPSNLKNDVNTEWIMIYNRIYNVTSYIDGITNPTTRKIDKDSENAYLNEDLTSLIVNKRGEDATDVYEALYNDDTALSCLDDLFYIGVMDEPPDMMCLILNYAMYSIMIIIAVVLAVQCLCSLIYLFRRKRTILRDDTRSKIIVMVPCYNEGDKELRKTIDSVMDSSYPDDNKVLLVVADGNITGKGEKKSTPDTLSQILGYTMKPTDRSYKCKSIGDLTDNRAKLYYGTMKDCGKELKYIVIVKTGIQSERGSPRAGNRGKRDSQLLFTGLLNRFHHGRKLNDLDVAMKNALDSMQVPLDEVRYLMAIDADTRIERDSISHMAYSMNKNDHILALCGETKVENKSQSWVTMIQVFEYYTNHHMKKAFESVFGCVTCLPGCFTMYRLYSDDGRPLLSCDDVYQRYATNNVKTLHDKNLYHLGEDRMLTTLLLRYFPDMRLSFVPEAHCYTIVPHTFKILLSQRRRWINSTFHNMLELVRVNTMCGVCCLSMKTIVVLDLIATLILPASLIYVGYIVYITFWMGEPLSMLMLVVWGIVIGVQVVVFLFRSRWDYWWWFFVFIILGVPVFYFFLPIYSFWHMDDFSWGATRQVAGSGNMYSKSRDETECSDKGFEVTADEFNQHTHPRASNRPSQVKKPPASRPIDVDEDLRKYSTAKQPQYSHPIDIDDITMDDFSCEVPLNTKRTDYDPRKYSSAEEAKRARRARRADC